MGCINAVHDTGDIRYRSPFGAVPVKSEVKLSIFVESEKTDKVWIRLWNNEKGEKIIEALSSEDGIWQGTVAVDTPGVYWYYFIVVTKDGCFYYSRRNDTDFGTGFLDCCPRHSFQITVYEEFSVPSWYREGVMYQIFPDRFYRVREGIQPIPYDETFDQVILDNRMYLVNKNEEDVPSCLRDPSTGDLSNLDYFGGTLKGIIEKLDYLQSLGINILYLNPVFEASSNHRYNTGDYFKIDPLLGDETTFEELCREGQKRGISIILDGVFSHTGSDSRYFNKEGRYPEIGAYQSKDSKYYSWYRFERYPDKYDCWWGVKSLPNVNETDPSYMDFIIRNEKSVVKYWMEKGAKGWRLDVADELPDLFLEELRRAVKTKDKDAVIIGEVWEDASNKISYGSLRSFLLGRQLDSVMNYPFRDRVLSYLTGKISGREFSLFTMNLYQNYPKQAFFSCMNLLGTHDVPRIRTLLGEAPSEDSLDCNEKKDYRLNRDQKKLADKRQELAVILQMTFPGVPAVYYGDEAGMEGYSDPFNRGVYPWGREDKDMIEKYKKWIRLRNENQALKKGEYIPLIRMKINFETQGASDVFGFIRIIRNNRDAFGEEAENGFVLVLVNRSTQKRHTLRIDLNEYRVNTLRRYPDHFEHDKIDGGVLTVTLPPLGYAVWTEA
jgi:cyclomaltodextrinase